MLLINLLYILIPVAIILIIGEKLSIFTSRSITLVNAIMCTRCIPPTEKHCHNPTFCQQHILRSLIQEKYATTIVLYLTRQLYSLLLVAHTLFYRNLLFNYLPLVEQSSLKTLILIEICIM